MSVIYLFHAESLSIVPNSIMQYITWFVVVWVVSIVLGVKLNEIRLRIKEK
jgi:hypothetical protein